MSFDKWLKDMERWDGEHYACMDIAQAAWSYQQARIEALEAERRWMPFEKPEQLPQTMWALNYSDPILVAILSGKTRFVRDDRYDFVQDRWDSGCVGVTHWMPLPEPPEAEK